MITVGNTATSTAQDCNPVPVREPPAEVVLITNAAVGDDVPRSASDQSTQTTAALGLKSPRKVMLRKKLHSLRVKLSRRKKTFGIVKERLFVIKQKYCSKNVVKNSFESIINAASNFLSADCLKWLEMQLNLARKSPQSRRYSDQAKHFALNLYFHGPKAYQFLSSIFFATRQIYFVIMASLNFYHHLKKIKQSM